MVYEMDNISGWPSNVNLHAFFALRPGCGGIHEAAFFTNAGGKQKADEPVKMNRR
jgi:hypothetical protein